ncbi:hypothetical protein ABZ636_37135 [Streptomyces sp. NPDC007251]|uniref:hypothetical protein n=1 Tax=Streptomyces sp. NPDC007251 TaxID=3154483 RepID=UPI0033D062CA
MGAAVATGGTGRRPGQVGLGKVAAKDNGAVYDQSDRVPCTVRLRIDLTHGADSRTAALARAFKLVESARRR